MSRLIVAIAALLVLIAAVFMMLAGQARPSSSEVSSSDQPSLAERVKDVPIEEAEPESRVVTFDESNFDELVRNSSKPVLVDFTAGWCAPCHLLSPTIDKLSVEFEDQVAFGKVDVDANPKLAEEHQAPPIPLLAFYKNGEVVARLVGRESEEKIRDVLVEITQPQEAAVAN